MSFQVPRLEDDFDNYGNESQDESRSSQGRLLFLSLLPVCFHSSLCYSLFGGTYGYTSSCSFNYDLIIYFLTS